MTGMRHSRTATSPERRQGSTLIIVLWIAFGLVSLTLYFAHSMSFELRAADNRVCGLAAEQAIDGAARYLIYHLTYLQTNGLMPNPATYLSEAVPVGNTRSSANERGMPHFWLIGRETNNPAGPDGISFGLIDEGAKLNLNSAPSNMLYYVPNMNIDLLSALLDWRNTNGGSGAYQSYYGMNNPPYQNKNANFESVDELRLVYGADLYTLVGSDANRNGILDPDEGQQSLNTASYFGITEYLTVFSREPNTYSNNAIARVNIRSVTQSGPLPQLLVTNLGANRAQTILQRLGLANSGGSSSRGTVTVQFTSPLQLYRASGMSSDEFAKISGALTTLSNTNYIVGRVNINTASATVLACLPGICDYPDLAQTLITYREQNPDKLTSIAWLVEAIGTSNSSVLDTLQRTDCITTESYQFTADVAALGPYGRGYRRVRFVLDTADGTPRIVYRQDLTHLGWALGQQARQNWLAQAQSSTR